MSTTLDSICTIKRSAMPESEVDEAVVPDSTTPVEKDRLAFSHGQEVLLKHKDGNYYFGRIVELDTIREQCLIRFDDNTNNWGNFKDLVKFNTTRSNICVTCKIPDEHEVIICNKCARWYHRHCHQPEIPPEYPQEGTTWKCKKCVDRQQLHQRTVETAKNMRKENIRKACSGVDTAAMPPTDRSSLPYDPDVLTWDTYHRVNIEQIYCYCGKNGEWYTQMLQCGRCKQWFHEKCVRCLKFPLYCGDRFYVFVCSLCNYGKEFVRRLELKWVDLVHLMLFNLTAFNVKKYYDLDTVIIPYVNDNWHALQLPPKILNVTKTERRDNILSVLTNNRNRFKCGREIKKRTTIWGLRVRLPPPAPCITLPSIGSITEAGLRERWVGNKRLQFLPDPLLEEESGIESGSFDSSIQGIMRGTAYQNNTNLSENESSSPIPSPVLASSTCNLLEDQSASDKNDYHGGGFVKKSVPFPKINTQRRKRLMSTNAREREKQSRLQSQMFSEHSSDNNERCIDSRLRKTRRLLKQNLPSETFSSMRKFQNENNYNESGCDTEYNANKNRKREELPPLTPPTSVSSPPTPPASSTPVQNCSGSGDTSSDCTLVSVSKSRKVSVKTRSRTRLKADKNHEAFSRGDSLSEDISLRDTLDLLIPIPENFEGSNNPFRSLYSNSSSSGYHQARQYPSLPIAGPIVRSTKRQLSEKDIRIGPNGEVKRRRFRRSRGVVGQLPVLAALGQPTASKTATFLPVRPETNRWSSAQRQTHFSQCYQKSQNNQNPDNFDHSYSQNIKNETTTKISKIGTTGDDAHDMKQLQNSVNSYFGMSDHFTTKPELSVKAKRVLSDGRVQYLIERTYKSTT